MRETVAMEATSVRGPSCLSFRAAWPALLGTIWLVNGLFCKVLDLVPRHEQIVARILGPEHARTWTVLIGISEVCMAICIWSRLKPRLSAVTQIVTIGSMNVLEFVLAADLLLWGRANLLFAAFLVVLIAREASLLRNPRGVGAGGSWCMRNEGT